MRRIARRRHRLGRSKRQLPGDRAERQERAWHVQVITRSQCNSGRRKEKADVGGDAGGPVTPQGLCLLSRVGNNFRELWATGGRV